MNKHFKDLPSFHVSSAAKRGSQFNQPNSFIQTPLERKEQAPKVYKSGTLGSAISNSEKEQGFDEIRAIVTPIFQVAICQSHHFTMVLQLTFEFARINVCKSHSLSKPDP